MILCMNVYTTKPDQSFIISWMVYPVFIIRDICENEHLLSYSGAKMFAREETYKLSKIASD